MRINVLVLVHNIQMVRRPTNKGHEIGKRTNGGHEIGKTTNGGHEIGRPTNGGHEIGRPTNGGHKSDYSKGRMMHDRRYRRFGFVVVKSDSISVIIGRRLLHFLTMSESVDDQAIIQRSGQNRAFEFEMNVEPKRMNE